MENLRYTSWLKVAFLIFVVIVLVTWLAKAPMPVDDFVEYWAASRLLWTGENPYSPELMGALQKSVGWQSETPLMMLNPPWTLFLVLPFGQMGYSTARLVWLLLNLLLTAFSLHWGWRLYRGHIKNRWVAYGLGLSFVPGLVTLFLGQISAFVAAGLVGFLLCLDRGKYRWAGACLLLVAVKPHLLYLFWPALLLWSLLHRNFRLCWGGGLAGLLATSAVVFLQPEVVSYYVRMMSQEPPHHQWVTPTFGTLLRLFLGMDHTVLQFVPMGLGIGWLVLYWRRCRQCWNWQAHTPMLLLVSLATTSFAWVFDQIVLLPALIQVAVWVSQNWQQTKSRITLLVYFLINGFLVVSIYLRWGVLGFLWVAPAWLLVYVFLSRPSTNAISSVTSDCRIQPLA